MPLSRSVARFNRRVTNRLLGPLAARLPGFGVLVHTGRKTRRRYRTPVNVFRRPGGYVVALTYGPETDWVRNVLAAGGCTLETRGRRLRLTRPRLFRDEQRGGVPAPVRVVLGLNGVADFLDLTQVEATQAAPGVLPTMPSGWVFSLFNPIAAFLLVIGVPMGPNGLITIRGRRSGRPRTTPVAIIEHAGRRWVWAPWGDVQWVRNLRSAGRATITVRRRKEDVRATELDPTERVGFFRDVLGPLARGVPLGAWFIRTVDGVDLDRPVEAAEGRRVFELHPSSGR
jgi:deazaflavin-dependent oxidoreductase (nitroreductase family)